MGLSFRFLSLLVFVSSVVVLMHPDVSLAGTCERTVARMVSVQGIVQVKRAGETQWQRVKLNETYCPGDVIQVGERSRADVALINQPVLRLDQNTVITLGGVKEERTSIIALLQGAAHFFSRVTRGLEVQTAFVNAGVEGTEFFIRVEKDKTFLSVFEGKVLASNAEGSLAITGGQSAVAEAGKAPVARVVVHPRDAVQWALYYPPVVYEHPVGLKENDPRFYTSRASSLLQVGRVEEAKADLGKALELDPNNSTAFALQSIIAVTQNEKEKALELAEKAVQSNPNSAEAHIALSYAQQASFNLEGALNSLKEAVRVQPENALAWARLAELRLSFGEFKEALNAAQKASALNPDISRTQTVLGFAFLSEVNTGESKKAFEKAIELDQADPLPRLGLGLSKIREGDVVEGGKDIEIAASLDSSNSLIRSYLGKTYFEEKRGKLSSEEYGIAKQLDPADPTSFFYDAILKQTTNRPVEALHDMEEAIDLNDNRAVYRSRLLLDSDLAARSASLARIYSDLGFQQLALVEGWKSENTDPSNFSAHRFLADSYSVLPRHEIARVSELLQSQLLQPINITPIQPHLGESNLFLVSREGPSSVSFLEFNPLFNRNQLTLQATGIVGNNNTTGEELVASGIYDKASFSVGQFHFRTDGWRTNADQNDNIVDAFFQYELSPETSVQAEYRYRDNKTGDLQLRFFPEDFEAGEKIIERKNTFRVGARHSFSPSSVVLASFIYTNVSYATKIDQPIFFPGVFDFYNLESPEEAYTGELQYLWSSRYVNLTAGAGYTTTNGNITATYRFVGLPITFEDPPVSTDLQHTNGYAYSYIKPLNNLTFTVGAGVDFTGGDSPDVADKSQFNPKFGLIWNPLPNTTVRAAVFRTLKRTLTTNQTLEPTQVAGFNQFYDDNDGTEAWRYGAAIDQKFSKDLFGGVECSQRTLKVPLVISPDEAPQFNWRESNVRAYFFWTAYRWVGLRVEYQYEKTNRDQGFTDGVQKLETNRVPLGISFYHPSGFSASVTTTYYWQQGTFDHLNAFEGSESGKDDFWLVDAAVSYRLPKRLGFITIGATNLFDKDFNYYDLDWKNPSIHPGRFLFGRVALALP
jgi:tetratricopeptide (TPR) repeat protein/predicted porin